MRIALVLAFCLSAGATEPQAFKTGIKFLVTEVEETWQMVKDNASPNNTKDGQKTFLEMMLKLVDRIEAVKKTSNVESTRKGLQTLLRYKRTPNKIDEPIRKIDAAFQDLATYTRSNEHIERLTLVDFATSAVSHSIDSVRSLLDTLHYVAIADTQYNNLVDVLTDTNLTNSSSCIVRESPYQLLYNLYQLMILTEMKGYAIIQFSYMLLNLNGRGTYDTESEIETIKFVDRSMKTTKTIWEFLTKASRHLWTCDPEKHIEGVTYIEITKLLQGYIENEVNLSKDGSCTEECETYQFGRARGKCQGTFLNCQFVESHMTVCRSSDVKKRRYEYIRYNSGRTLGRNEGTCPTDRLSVYSWGRWFVHCSYCLCLCDEEGENSDRYISMVPVVSNTTKNMVVAGLRFTKSNRIVHLQIQEGKLLPGGNIDKDTLSWVPVRNYTLYDRGVYKDSTFFTLAWNKRDIDLDVLTGRDGYVLTGVQFQKIGAHLNFQIRITPFAYKTGILQSHLSEWVHNVNTGEKRKRIDLSKRDVPTRSYGRSEIRSTHNEFLEMTQTHFYKDAGQTIVPFFDAQGVSSVTLPNSGAGIYFKSIDEKSGGFIGLKLVTYDYARQLLHRNDFSVPYPRPPHVY